MSDTDLSGQPAAVDHVVAVVERLGGKVISLLGWIIGLTFFVFAVFTGAYFYAVFCGARHQSSQRRAAEY